MHKKLKNFLSVFENQVQKNQIKHEIVIDIIKNMHYNKVNLNKEFAMKTIKIIGAEWEKVSSPKRDENEERSYDNWTGSGLPQLCGCCGKVIKDVSTAKSLRLIEGGDYWTEHSEDDVFEFSGEMGWWYVGPDCYKKYTKNKKEIEVEIEKEKE